MHIGDQSNTINKIDLIIIYRELHPTITTAKSRQALKIHVEKKISWSIK